MGGFVLRWGMIAIALVCAISERAVAQDVAAGQKAFVVCRACHQIGPNAKNFVGPVLNGVVGRKAGTYPGYSYSEANKDSGHHLDPRGVAEIPRRSPSGGKGHQDDLPRDQRPREGERLDCFPQDLQGRRFPYAIACQAPSRPRSMRWSRPLATLALAANSGSLTHRATGCGALPRSAPGRYRVPGRFHR